jgi:hypothetical protein
MTKMFVMVLVDVCQYVSDPSKGDSNGQSVMQKMRQEEVKFLSQQQ